MLVWGTYLRVDQLSVAPFWIDEAFSLESTNNVPTTDSLLWLRAWLYHQVLGLVTALFGESGFSTRFPSAIASLIGAGAVTGLCYQRFGRLPALLALCLLAFGYWHIAWARQVREYAWLMSAFWLGMLLIDRWVLRAKRLHITKFAILVVLAKLTALIHPFGFLLFVCAILALLINPALLSHRHRLMLFAVFLLATFCAAYLWLPDRVSFKRVYLPFIWQHYWLMALFSLGALMLLRDQSSMRFLIWLIASCTLGFTIIAFFVPLVNLRYVYFLTPLFAVLIAASVAVFCRHKSMSSALIAGALSIMVVAALLHQGTLTLMPHTAYPLESFKAQSGFRYYTPQPRFDLAYRYINNRLNDKDLVTPYPAMSRRYRAIDDTLAINAKVSYGKVDAKTQQHQEYYTGVPFADGHALFQLANATGEIYILIDQMALERVDSLMTILLKEHAELVRRWQKRPYSTLYLYKLKAQ